MAAALKDDERFVAERRLSVAEHFALEAETLKALPPERSRWAWSTTSELTGSHASMSAAPGKRHRPATPPLQRLPRHDRHARQLLVRRRRRAARAARRRRSWLTLRTPSVVIDHSVQIRPKTLVIAGVLGLIGERTQLATMGLD